MSHGWQLIGEVGVDVGTMIIADSEYFLKYRVLEDVDATECIKNLEKVGYSVPWLGGDGNWNIFGHYSENSQKRVLKIIKESNIDDILTSISLLDSILIYEGNSVSFEIDRFKLKNISSSIEFKKIKKYTINIKSQNIAINDPVNAFYRDYDKLENSFSLGVEFVDIYDLKILYKSEDQNTYEVFIGTLIECEKSEPLTKEKLLEGVPRKLISINNKLKIKPNFSFLKNRIEHSLINTWTQKEIESNLENGFNGNLNIHLKKGYEATFCLGSKNSIEKEKNFVDAFNSFSKKHKREIIFEKPSDNFRIACTIKAMPSGFASIVNSNY